MNTTKNVLEWLREHDENCAIREGGDVCSCGYKNRPKSYETKKYDEAVQKVFKGKRVTTTITFLPYGGLWRVKHVTTLNCRQNSQMMSCSDVEYHDRSEAIEVFESMCSIWN